MKIEAGKYYRTRDGRKAYVACIVGENPFDGESLSYSVSGFIEGRGFTCWEPGGEHTFGLESASDLIEEYREPEKVVRWIHAVRSRTGGTVIVESRHRLEAQDLYGKLIGRKRIEIIEGVFDE